MNNYTKKLYNYALEYFVNTTYDWLKELVDLMIDKVIVLKDKTKPIKIILNVYPGDFDLDEYFYDREIIREFENIKTQLGKYQIEFSEHYSKENALEWGDFKFIKLLKKKFNQLFINGGWYRIRTYDPLLVRQMLSPTELITHYSLDTHYITLKYTATKFLFISLNIFMVPLSSTNHELFNWFFFSSYFEFFRAKKNLFNV